MSRPATRVAILAMAGLAFGCAESGDMLSADRDFEAVAELSPGVHVLNTQLRGIIDPDIEPSPAWGFIQLKLSDDGEEGYLVEWKGKLFNPANEVFSTAAIIDPEIVPDENPLQGDGDPPIIVGGQFVYLFFRDATQSCDILLFDSQAVTDEEHIPAEIAQNMIINPEIHEVVLISTEGSLVTGRFGLPDPTTVLGFNPQPDPPGKVVRCETGE